MNFVMVDVNASATINQLLHTKDQPFTFSIAFYEVIHCQATASNMNGICLLLFVGVIILEAALCQTSQGRSLLSAL